MEPSALRGFFAWIYLPSPHERLCRLCRSSTARRFAAATPSPGKSNPRPRNRKEPNMHPDPDDDNHANQCNPNNDEYWHSREQ